MARLAIVGCGSVAHLHAATLAADHHSIATVVGHDPTKTRAFADQVKATSWSLDLVSALDDPSIDGVIVASPSGQHATHTAACIAAGKPTLTEIPLALSLDDGEALVAAAASKDVPLLVAMTHRFHQPLSWIREEVVADRMTPRSVHARYSLMRRTDIGSSGRLRSWTDDLLWHHGHHSVDMALWMLGCEDTDRLDIVALSSPAPDEQRGPLDIGAVVRTDRGQLLTFALSYNSHLDLYDYLVTADDRSIHFDRGSVHAEGITLPAFDVGVDSRATQNREFAVVATHRGPTRIDARSVLPAMRVLDRMQPLLWPRDEAKART